MKFLTLEDRQGNYSSKKDRVSPGKVYSIGNTAFYDNKVDSHSSTPMCIKYPIPIPSSRILKYR